MKDFKEDVQSLINLCRELSLSRLKWHIGYNELTEREFNPEKPDDLGESLSLVFFTSIGIKLNFKTHFSLQNARLFAAKGLGVVSDDSLSKEMIEDFMKEYCNLFAGAIKKSFENKGFDASISLPFLTRAKDKVFFDQHKETEEKDYIFQDTWEILMEESFIRNQVLIEIYDSDILSKVVEESESDEGDGSFFF